MNAETRPKPGPGWCAPIIPPPVDPVKSRLTPEAACRVVNVAWAIIAGRLPWASHVERIHELQAAGLVNDETQFGSAAPSW